MRFNVSSLLQEATGSTRKYEFESLLEAPGLDPERVAGAVEFLRTPSGILVRARLGLVEPEICSRCLKPLDQRVDIHFEEEFQAVFDPRTGRPLPKEERDPDAFLIDEKNSLDLNEAVRQYREVSLLMKPLCRADCMGLCPECGADRNEGHHDCGAAPLDARWAGLAAFKGSDLAGKD